MSNGPYIQKSEVASSVPFDNSSNGFIATDVQAAIEEARFTVNTIEVSNTTTITAGTGADALMTTMTITPSAGTYLVLFSCDLNCSTAGAATSFSLYINGVQDASSIRKVAPFDGGTLSAGSARCGVNIMRTVVVTAGSIEVRWSASNGTNTAAARTLTAVRIA